MHQVLFQELPQQAEAAASYLNVDSAPVESVKFARSQSGKRSILEAEYGYVAARKQVCFGLRLHTLVSDTGAVVDFGLTPADASVRDVAREMLDHRPGVSVLADQGYSGRPMQQYADEWGVERIVTAPRVHGGDRAPGAAERRSWRQKRTRIELVFAVLSDQFGVSVTQARSTLGVAVRVVAKVLAYNVSLVLNQRLGRSETAIKSLFA